MEWEKGLEKNTPVYNFVTSNEKRIRVIAGPGTGKSFALKKRILRLLEAEDISPESILVLTFTKLSAKDLKTDLLKLSNENPSIKGIDKIVANTIHGLCYDFISKYPEISPGRKLRTLLDFEKESLLNDLDDKYGNRNKKKKRLNAFEAAVKTDEYDGQFYSDVLDWLKIHNAMLFGELVTQTICYLEENPSSRKLKKYKHILVDEYQDLNQQEQKLIGLLANEKSLVVIGDDNQSIYSFKHAHPEGIINFHETHPTCKDFNFPECRRTPKKVLEKASKLISHSKNPSNYSLSAYKDVQEGHVCMLESESFDEEVRKIAERIESDKNNYGIDNKDILILAPLASLVKKAQQELEEHNNSSISYFKHSFLSSNLTKEAFSLLTLMVYPNDNISLDYLLSKGSKIRLAGKNELTRDAVMSKIEKIKKTITIDRNLLSDELMKDSTENEMLKSLIAEAVNEIDFTTNPTVRKWLKQVHSYVYKRVLFPEKVFSSTDDYIKIMSLHASKGLGAKYVIIMHATDDKIPLKTYGNIEDQRRLFYVAVTRCKNTDEKDNYQGTLIISKIKNRESRFLREMGV